MRVSGVFDMPAPAQGVNESVQKLVNRQTGILKPVGMRDTEGTVELPGRKAGGGNVRFGEEREDVFS